MKKGWIALFMVIIFITLFSGCSKDSSITVPIKNGLLDLSVEQYQNSGIIPLSGEWQFYWNEFVPFNQLDTRNPDLMADVPNSWIFHTVDGKPLNGKGYATYRLHVKTVAPDGTILSIKMPTMSSAYEMYIDEKLVAANGKIGTKASDEQPEYKPMVATFSTPSRDFDITIYVSNFHYAHGGFWNPAYIGIADKVIALQEQNTRYESIILGALLVVSLFFFAVFLLNKEFKYALYFALTCLSLGILLDMVGEMSIIKMFDIKSFNVTVWLWYSSIIWFLFAFNLYLHELFPSKYSKISLRFFVLYFVVVESIYTFTSPDFYGGLALITNYFEMAWFANLAIIVCIGVWKKKKGAWLNFASVFIALISYIFDVLTLANQVRFDIPQTRLYGILLLVFIQMLIQAGRIKVYQEQIVSSELAFLQSQIKPHFLYNALNVIISVSRDDTERSRDLLVEFSNYLRRSFDFKDISQFTLLKNEIELANSYVEIEKARFEERLEVSFDFLDQQDYQVPVLVLQPIIENAIVHGILTKPEGGKVEVSIKQVDCYLEFCVKDNGVGFDVSKLLLSHSKGVRKGVGIRNISERLKKMYGKGLSIVSNQGIGTEVKWTISLNRKESLK
jgi:sensor histidine kinase YesM